MKAKTFSLVALSIFTLVLVAGLTSAVTSSAFDITNLDFPANVSEDKGSFTFTFNLTYDGNSEDIDISFSDSTTSIGDVSIPTETGLNGSISSSGETRTVTGTISNFANQGGNTANVVINATTGSSTDDETTFSVNILDVPTFCKSGAFLDDEDGADKSNDLDEIDFNVDISNEGEGEDGKWLALDTINVEVELENTFDEDGDMDLDDVTLELGIFAKSDTELTDNLAEDMIWISEGDEEFDLGDVDEDEKASHTFEFRVDPSEFDERNYILMVKAYTDEEPDDNEGFCIDYSNDLEDFGDGDSQFSAEFEIEQENDRDKMVVVDTAALPLPLEASCGEDFLFTADVYNIGDEDFADRVLVRLFNEELGLNVQEVIRSDLDAGENEEVSFRFNVPRNVDEGTYRLSMSTLYEYDEDDDEYDTTSDDEFVAYLKIEGGCVYATPETTSVSASLESEARAGREMVIKTTVTNSGDYSANYDLELGAVDSWASIVGVEPSSFTLNSGESQEVTITLNIDSDVEGEQGFNIGIYSEDVLIKEQPVAVSVEPRSSLAAITGNAINEGNWHLWAIGFFNVVLLVAIVIVAARVVRKRE